MAKLQVLSGALTGQSYELRVDKNTLGRVEDNTIQIADPSVSSHHCEILLRGDDVVIKDLNSTNGTFINGDRIAEMVLKPGQTLRLGQIDFRLDDGTPLPTPSATTASAAPPMPPAPTGTKQRQEPTMVVQRGISLDQLKEVRSTGFDTATSGFTKKTNSANRFFVVGAIVLGVIILIVLVLTLNSIK
jgi:pSer/pThr/pTyr-binding forkhead associated (FHA) protein